MTGSVCEREGPVLWCCMWVIVWVVCGFMRGWKGRLRTPPPACLPRFLHSIPPFYPQLKCFHNVPYPPIHFCGIGSFYMGSKSFPNVPPIYFIAQKRNNKGNTYYEWKKTMGWKQKSTMAIHAVQGRASEKKDREGTGKTREEIAGRGRWRKNNIPSHYTSFSSQCATENED